MRVAEELATADVGETSVLEELETRVGREEVRKGLKSQEGVSLEPSESLVDEFS